MRYYNKHFEFRNGFYIVVVVHRRSALSYADRCMAPTKSAEVENMVKFGVFLAPKRQHDAPIKVKFVMKEYCRGLFSHPNLV